LEFPVETWLDWKKDKKSKWKTSKLKETSRLFLWVLQKSDDVGGSHFYTLSPAWRDFASGIATSFVPF
jgi:hypothetical protein